MSCQFSCTRGSLQANARQTELFVRRRRDEAQKNSLGLFEDCHLETQVFNGRTAILKPKCLLNHPCRNQVHGAERNEQCNGQRARVDCRVFFLSLLHLLFDFFHNLKVLPSLFVDFLGLLSCLHTCNDLPHFGADVCLLAVEGS